MRYWLVICHAKTPASFDINYDELQQVLLRRVQCAKTTTHRV